MHTSPCDEEHGPFVNISNYRAVLNLTRCVRKRDKDEDRKEIDKNRGGEVERDNGEAKKIKRDADG